jgi:hypothetical protein
MASCVLFILYCGIAGIRNQLLFISIVIIFIEGIILFLNKFKCPLTTLAMKYGNPHARFSDIFLPRQFAVLIMPLFTTLFAIGLILVIIRFF